MLGFVAGFIAHGFGRNGESRLFNAVGAVAGSLSYVVVYLLKNFINEYYILRNPIETVVTKLVIKGSSSVVNGITAVIVALILLPAFKKAMKASGISEKLVFVNIFLRAK